LTTTFPGSQQCCAISRRASTASTRPSAPLSTCASTHTLTPPGRAISIIPSGWFIGPGHNVGATHRLQYAISSGLLYSWRQQVLGGQVSVVTGSADASVRLAFCWAPRLLWLHVSTKSSLATEILARIRTTSHCSAMRSLGKGLRDCCDLAGQVSRQHRDQRWQISGWQRDLELDAGRYDTDDRTIAMTRRPCRHRRF